MDQAAYKFQLWDTAGQEKYHSLAPMYYRNAAAAMLVYDITSAKTFARLKAWVRELRELGPEGIIIVVCGNKADLEAKRVRACVRACEQRARAAGRERNRRSWWARCSRAPFFEGRMRSSWAGSTN